ncbi:ERF family protein [Salmonella enterica]|uniref:Recombinase n=7 Tax=Salmonella enterica TaxID=28901 RepID=A0A5U3CPY0_SALDZ|nr:ERF family protein [Salmonella enterica]EAA8865243.1 recombinase [Salmonella enterica subsp. enterica serovar Choleraesuis]EBP3411463.1 recombinase [Salmonella enterica subsp. diarizonae]ECT9717775.1 recombinase [Salmonella enterica subsp. diarizonae str. CFSAN000553]EDQ7380021.1 ERF family protein [Salmonella enterica subsp. diarizonae serovar 35:l,v:z35]EDX5033552.1 ERF family protein [Salmonella enterica subsp. enterica serovar Saintpaul]EEE2067267.1 ERF family protein [Salmonella enter
MAGLIQKLINIQSSLNAPKNQYNSFGKYHYRSCEDIMAALKPLLKQEGVLQYITDEVVLIGNRFYVKSTVTLTDGESSISNAAFAREEETKKGADGSQITGSASSYARKYALNGMYNIDDAKDADTDEHKQQQNAVPAKQAKPAPSSHSPEQVLKAFSEYAATETDKKKLIERYQHDWQLLTGHDDEQTKCVQVMNIRINELKQVA